MSFEKNIKNQKVEEETKMALFPEGFVKMKQGGTGDCYLLTFLEMALNHPSHAHDRRAIESLFELQENGSVEIRLKRNKYSKNLKENLKGSHGKGLQYLYRKGSKEDVFILSPEKVDEIKKSKEGVETEVLGVKILERLVPYYFDERWDPKVTNASVRAHNISGDRFLSSEDLFTELFGFRLMLPRTKNLSQIVRFKERFPNTPLYFRWSIPDENGVYQSGHAFCLDKIKKLSDGRYEFHLINPYNGQQVQTEIFDEIKFKEWSCAAFAITSDLTPLTPRFDAVISAAISAKLEEDKQLDRALAERVIRSGLEDYVKYSNLNYLTKSGGLRDYFEFGIFNKEDIQQYLRKNIEFKQEAKEKPIIPQKAVRVPKPVQSPQTDRNRLKIEAYLQMAYSISRAFDKKNKKELNTMHTIGAKEKAKKIREEAEKLQLKLSSNQTLEFGKAIEPLKAALNMNRCSLFGSSNRGTECQRQVEAIFSRS